MSPFLAALSRANKQHDEALLRAANPTDTSSERDIALREA
jgi:hypothetical protein